MCTFRYRARDWVNTRGVCIHSTDGSWSVRYEGNKGSADDPRKVLKHKLCILNPVRPVDMEVIFIPFVWMKYWLIYMSGESRFMLVGSTSMDLLWFMALYANPPIDDYEALKTMAASLGNDVAKYERVSQSEN